MDIKSILDSLQGCPCGRPHNFDTERVEIGRGLVHRVGDILAESNFPKNILLVADDNTLGVSEGLLASLKKNGFHVKKLIYDDMKYARAEQVEEIEGLAADCEGIISVGTGSLNDICRVAAFREEKDYCIFATAPSMDGFASDTAPIVQNSFKSSWQAKQPRIIIGDTEILAASPAELKSAGFGDMMAKYIGLVDWHIARILIDEYYCEKVAAITEEAIRRIVALADNITGSDPEAAGAVMEALVLTGLAMKLAACSRPASGSEHIISHYLECHKVIADIWPDYHGKKVGVATLIINKIYRNIADRVAEINPTKDTPDWNEIYKHFSAEQIPEVEKLNNPSIMDKVDPADLKAKWQQIREIIWDVLPENDELLALMKTAGCAITPEEINVSPELFAEGLYYHAYMRYRILVTRMMPSMGIDALAYVD